MDIIKITKEKLDLDPICQLLKQQDSEQFYFFSLGQDASQMAEFLKYKILKRVHNQSEHNKLFALSEGNEYKALFGIDINTLHTNIFGRDIIEIGPFYLSKDINTEDVTCVIGNILQELQHYKYPYYKVKIDSSDMNAVDIFSSIGFQYCTTAIKVLYNPSTSHSKFDQYYVSRINTNENMYYVDTIQYSEYKSTIDRLIEQHKKSIHYYMYKNDFEEKSIYQLFREWFSIYSQHINTTLLGLFTKQNELIGFTSFNGPIVINSASVYSRDLTIIDNNYQGYGLASILYKELNKVTGNYIEGNPLSDNYRNLKLNLNCGYSIVKSRVYLKYDSLSKT